MAQKKSGGGWLTVLGFLFLLGLTVQYWYVAVPLLVVLVGGAAAASAKQRKAQRELLARQQEAARHRPGPRDPWINEIAVALAEFGFTEYARNTGSQLAGVPIEGDIQLLAPQLSVVITLFATAGEAHEAEIGLRAKPEVTTAIRDGTSVARAVDRVLYTANGRGGLADEFRLNEVIQLVQAIPVGPPRIPSGAPAPTPVLPAARPAMAASAAVDVLDQIKRLGELRASGVLTEAEFDAKKAELLRRF